MQSIDLIKKYLKEHRYTVKEISLGLDSPTKYLHVSRAGKSGYIMSAKYLTGYSGSKISRDIIADKAQTYSLADYLNIPRPSTLMIDSKDYSISQISNFLDEHRNIVVKPYNGNKSRGVSINVSDIDRLKSSIEIASDISQKVLVQQQVYGEEVRLIVIEGKVRAALLREKPFVIGDGTSSIKDLVAEENSKRDSIKNSLVTYPRLDHGLISADLDLNSVPAKGQRIELSQATMIRNGASVYDIYSQIDKGYIEAAETTVKNLHAGLLCVDFIIKDYKSPATPESYSLIEINTGMSLLMCYSCRDGKNFPIVEDYIGPKIVSAIESTL